MAGGSLWDLISKLEDRPDATVTLDHLVIEVPIHKVSRLTRAAETARRDGAVIYLEESRSRYLQRDILVCATGEARVMLPLIKLLAELGGSTGAKWREGK
ncbi:hypothetical protein [Nonomuraea sp. NPDC023979]|uniref:hypothetical protein n=1 Tax=Nonomuraea sp. NPDC023979 TaxID=3154796 RepID=UPI0033FB859F